ncbi:hypothetical protein JCM19233_4614 [Vibrio astriarenae]|nr:hypothetical protein JCM19233_4614 [Vibrio sp. C7]
MYEVKRTLKAVLIPSLMKKINDSNAKIKPLAHISNTET